MPRLRTAAEIAALKRRILLERAGKSAWIAVCTGTGCCAYGAEGLADALQQEIERRGIGHEVGLRRTGCHGFCERGPVVVIQPKGICYFGTKAKDVPLILDKSVQGDGVVESLLYLDEETGKRVRRVEEIPFYKHPKRILLENNVLIDATSILDYIAVGGYSALARALTKMSPEAVLDEVKRADLRGAGAFVSGESTALMNAIEGHVGEPRPKYVHTSEKGLWGKPTCLNNVETWANVPFIINHGADWFRSMGTRNSKGTKIFSLVGKVKNSGLVEVPVGITLRDIIFKIGGGVPKGKKFKAVQTGGPSGGVLPESLLDLPVDFDKLDEAGSMMGSGGMIVMDEDTCMVDTARYYVNFLAHESCGKCVPCREGLRQMLKILDRITAGEGKEGDIELLEELSEFMELASLCALGRTAPNPVRSTIRYFREEYEAHIHEKRCPAGVCTALMAYEIDPEKCTSACGACARACAVDAIQKIDDTYAIAQEKCIKCGSCYTACPDKFHAVLKLPASAVLRQAPIPPPQIESRV